MVSWKTSRRYHSAGSLLIQGRSVAFNDQVRISQGEHRVRLSRKCERVDDAQGMLHAPTSPRHRYNIHPDTEIGGSSMTIENLQDCVYQILVR
jgi:hypothetical protein